MSRLSLHHQDDQSPEGLGTLGAQSSQAPKLTLHSDIATVVHVLSSSLRVCDYGQASCDQSNGRKGGVLLLATWLSPEHWQHWAPERHSQMGLALGSPFCFLAGRLPIASASAPWTLVRRPLSHRSKISPSPAPAAAVSRPCSACPAPKLSAGPSHLTSLFPTSLPVVSLSRPSLLLPRRLIVRQPRALRRLFVPGRFCFPRIIYWEPDALKCSIPSLGTSPDLSICEPRLATAGANVECAVKGSC